MASPTLRPPPAEALVATLGTGLETPALPGHRGAQQVALAIAATLGSVAMAALLDRDVHVVGWLSAAVIALTGVAGWAAWGWGRLSRAIDGLLESLSQRAHELDVERRSLFHQEKMAAVGAMAAGVLHDIGNPIAAIDGVARAMRDAQASGDCVIGEGLCDPALILQETARLQAITRMIAGLAAPPSTAAALLNVNDVVQTALLLLHFDTRLSGVRIDASLDPQLPAVWGVSDALLQLVMNLVTNAGDAVSAGGVARPLIRVKTRVVPDGAEITIADNGCGMSDDVLRRAFEPLFTTKPSGRGTGLGLPLCRSIARQHGGDVTLQSAPGVGTRARVRLAAIPAAAMSQVT